MVNSIKILNHGAHENADKRNCNSFNFSSNRPMLKGKCVTGNYVWG